jgi:ankyrin repeat protein
LVNILFLASLHYAACLPTTDYFELFAEGIEPVNVLSKDGFTPLTYAVMAGRVSQVDITEMIRLKT